MESKNLLQVHCRWLLQRGCKLESVARVVAVMDVVVIHTTVAQI